MALVLSQLKGDLQDMFDNPKNSADQAGGQFAGILEDYLMASQPPFGGKAVSGSVKSIIRPIASALWANPNNPVVIASGQIAMSIMQAVMSIQYVGTCFGSGKVIMFNMGALKMAIVPVWLVQYDNPQMPAAGLAAAIHTSCLTSVAMGTGMVAPHPCAGPKIGTII